MNILILVATLVVLASQALSPNIFPGYIIKCDEPKTVALTFDDGPSDYTDKLLEILAKYSVLATFFVLGEQVDYDNNKFHPVLKKMYDAGHQIASHSYSHADHVKLTDAQMRLETKKTEVALLNSPVNVHPNYWRPPEGETDERVQKVIESMGYKVVIWDLDTKDYTYMNDIPGRAKIVSTILDHLVDSHIALAHDIHEFSVDKMDELIKGILVKGYKLDTVGNCVKDALPYYRNKPNNLPPTLLPPKDGLHGNTTVVDTTKDVNNVKVTKGKSLDETSKKLENSAISERKAGGLAVTMLLVTIILGGSIMI